MSDLIKCSRCKKIIIEEEYDSHECMPEIKFWKTIKFTNYYIFKNKLGHVNIGIRSLDGVKYDFIEVPEDKFNTKIPYEPTKLSPTRRNFTERKSDEDYTEPQMLSTSYFLISFN